MHDYVYSLLLLIGFITVMALFFLSLFGIQPKRKSGVVDGREFDSPFDDRDAKSRSTAYWQRKYQEKRNG